MTSQEQPQTRRRGITGVLTLGLFSYLVLSAFITLLIEPKTEPPSYWDELFADHPNLSLAALIGSIVFLVVVGAALFREVWNRLVTDLFALRPLSYQEALAVTFIAAIITV